MMGHGEKMHFYQLDSEASRDALIRLVTVVLAGEKKVLFAYLHGSFQEDRPFRDVDIAVFVRDMPEQDFLEFELGLEAVLAQKLPYPVDVRVLNNAPPTFCYKVFLNGLRIIDRDERIRVDFETRTYQKHFDFLPFRRRYLKEALESEV